MIEGVFCCFCFLTVCGVKLEELRYFRTCFARVLKLWNRLVRLARRVFIVRERSFWFDGGVRISFLGFFCCLSGMICSIGYCRLSLASLPSVFSVDSHTHLLTSTLEV